MFKTKTLSLNSHSLENEKKKIPLAVRRRISSFEPL